MPLTCITRAVWCNAPTIRGGTEDRAIQLSAQLTRLKREDKPPVYLSAIQTYRLIPDDRYEPDEWKATTRGYAYTAYDTVTHAATKALAWHWHPGSGGTDEPHMHIYRDGQVAGMDLDRLHFPAERVAFESVVKFVIDELKVTPLRDDWKDLIDSALERFVRFRTWPRSGGPLSPA